MHERAKEGRHARVFERRGDGVRGDDITGLKAHSLVSRGIGYVPQNNNVFPALTIEENLFA